MLINTEDPDKNKEINKEKENVNNKLFNDYFDYSNPGTMIKRLRDESDKKKNKNMVELINKKLK